VAAAGTRWTFGVAPLPETLALATRLRDVAGLVLSLEAPHPALERLAEALRRAQEELARIAPESSAPRVGAAADSSGRVYLDHSRDVGAFNPCFPTYALHVDGERAAGRVRFPLVYEGPPGVVHGGFLAVFFDSVVQHHNCDVGIAGRTTSLRVTYRRPTPLLTDLPFEVERRVEDGRIVSSARLLSGGAVLCEAEVRAIAGDRARLPEVSPRRIAT
jgi:acyl-coenzyme A thioesterase PaaI-like protein